MASSEEVLRRLTIGDPTFCRRLMSAQPDQPVLALDPRSMALVRLCGSITAGRGGHLLVRRVEEALVAGLDFDDIVASLLALAPTLGVDRLVAIAPDVARALGYDIDAALEQLE
jgi:hypothetical protein